MINKYIFDSNNEGKKILILGAVHGNEIAGTKASEKIMELINTNKLELKSGSITFMPLCNQKANEKDIREIDINLNRVIKHHKSPKLYEEFLANEIASEIDKHDVVLDIHSTSNPKDIPFCFLDYPNDLSENLISHIGVGTALLGWPNIYDDNNDISDYSTEKYAYENSKTGITVECGSHKDVRSVDMAEKAIMNLLTYFNIIDGDLTKNDLNKITMKEIVMKEKEGKFLKEFNTFDEVKKGDEIAIYEDGTKIYAPYDFKIIMPKPFAKVATEWFYIAT